jgi:hypothetical protein
VIGSASADGDLDGVNGRKRPDAEPSHFHSTA